MVPVGFRGVSDEFWAKVEPLIPVGERPQGREYRRKAGGGRKPMMPRQVFCAILYVLRMGIQWKALPSRYGSASTVHRHFLEWEQKGFFQALWRTGLAEHEEMEGLRWEWQNSWSGLKSASQVNDFANGDSAESRMPETQSMSASGRSWRPAVARRRRR